MKALVKSKNEAGLWLEDVEKPRIGINDVLIRVHRAGICGTDVHIFKWDDWARKTIPIGLVIGHEFVGEIAEVGSNVADFYPGDIVSGEGHVVCGRCRNCLAGRRHLCAHTQGIGVNRAGAFAEYIALPMTNIWRHPDGIDQDVAAIFDPFGNAVHTALSFPVLGEDVLVTGAGPIGIMAAAVARHAGARYVVITDLNEYRLALARKMGVTEAVNIREHTLPEIQKKLGMTEGFDVGLEMSGNQAAFRDMLANMSHGAQHRHAGHSGRRHGHRLAHRGLQYADHQRHLRPRDVRDLVQDDRDAAIRPGHHAPHHPPLPLHGVCARLRRHGQRPIRQSDSKLAIALWGRPSACGGLSGRPTVGTFTPKP